MSDGMTEEIQHRLNGRTKRQLIEDMIVRSPNPMATEKMVKALEVYPLLILLLAHDHPTKIWILDRGENPSSAEILDDEAKSRRWHSQKICIDECEGLTDVVGEYVAMVVSWKTLLVMRHEFAHVSTTFFSPRVRNDLEQLYRNAQEKKVFVEPLAAESIGEYISCGLSYYFFPDLKQELKDTDQGLYALVERILHEAEMVSESISTPVETPTEAQAETQERTAGVGA